MLTRLLWRIERAPSWLEYVFVRETGSKEEAVEAEPLDVGCSIVATDMSVAGCLERLVRSLALDMRVGTSDRIAEFIYAFAAEAALDDSMTRSCFKDEGPLTFVCWVRVRSAGFVIWEIYNSGRRWQSKANPGLRKVTEGWVVG